MRLLALYVNMITCDKIIIKKLTVKQIISVFGKNSDNSKVSLSFIKEKYIQK
ncbi:hypothetical protein M2263_002276 [Providencia alcalifaciens]|nr:hypothetical protein [Providencia alcalifaciens]